MLKVAQIANILDVTVKQVHNYINQGHLKATKKENVFEITEKNFTEFKNTYYYNRHKLKGKRIPSQQHLITLKEFVLDLEKNTLSYDDFISKYSNINLLVPSLEQFLLYKRNTLIIQDRNNNMTYKELHLKYKISVRQIEEIVKKSKERSN